MNDAKLSQLVAEAVAVDRDIRLQQARLKDLKRRLVAEAQSRQEELVNTEGGGASIRFVGADGCVANVTFPAPTLKGTVDGVGKTIERIMQAAGDHFYDLFEQTPAWKPKPAFRDLAAKFLGRAAGKLLRLCQTESQPRVSFETKEAEAVNED